MLFVTAREERLTDRTILSIVLVSVFSAFRLRAIDLVSGPASNRIE